MLEERLGSIQVVTGTLKVLRSYPLLSLSFLKSLRRLEGIRPNKSRDFAQDSFQCAVLVLSVYSILRQPLHFFTCCSSATEHHTNVFVTKYSRV